MNCWVSHIHKYRVFSATLDPFVGVEDAGLELGDVANCLLAQCLSSGILVVFESSALAALPSA